MVFCSTGENMDLNYNYNVILPPVHKVVLPPPSQLWDYRAYNNHGYYDQDIAVQQQQLQQQHQQNAIPSQPRVQTRAPQQALSVVQVQSQQNTSLAKKKPRRKRQCPDCSMWFSNLSTHRAIHLTPEQRPFLCEICGRGFSRSNDLFRHGKRHWKEVGDDKGAFKCPFNTILHPPHTVSVPPQASHGEGNDEEHIHATACHPTGVFSRCDTYKNHLKALHFDYPQGTKKKDRTGVKGHCKQCGKLFNNVNEWLDLHVESGECGVGRLT